MNGKKIKVLVVDDSRVAREVLVHVLESDPGIQVVGALGDGQDAVDFMAENRPDAVVMDLNMPRLDGLEATRQIMEVQPVPIIICSATTDTKAVATTFRLMEAGAIACVEKPVSSAHPEFGPCAANLLQTVKLMSEVKVVRRWPRGRRAPALPANPAANGRSPSKRKIQCVGLGASTGGPPVLCRILSLLPKDFPAPILIVQHIARGFLPGLAEWLNGAGGIPVHIASHGAHPLPGQAYLAPDDVHLELGGAGRISLVRDEPDNGLRPSVARLFRSLADVCGERAVGVLLTGMGKDGADELKLMRERGALTIAQDQESSVVHGMPAAAIALNAAACILPPDKIADALVAAAHTPP